MKPTHLLGTELSTATGPLEAEEEEEEEEEPRLGEEEEEEEVLGRLDLLGQGIKSVLEAWKAAFKNP